MKLMSLGCFYSIHQFRWWVGEIYKRFDWVAILWLAWDDVLQNVAKDLDASEQQRLQQQLASLSQVVDNCLQSQLELTVHREMQQSILPGQSRCRFLFLVSLLLFPVLSVINPFAPRNRYIGFASHRSSGSTFIHSFWRFPSINQ